MLSLEAKEVRNELLESVEQFGIEPIFKFTGI